MGGGGKGSSKVTTGYRYFAGLHLIFCHAVDVVRQIRVGDATAWEGAVTENGTITIDKPELFGGDKREGGVSGKVDVCFGAADQPANGYLQGLLGSGIPAFRGLFGLVARKCMLSANNPYVKEWSVMATRTATGWREDLANITAADGLPDMNPAHIIREALTNQTWGGLGYPVADLDDGAFQTAANLLHAEGLGISLLWAKNSSVEDFIRLVLDHIDGVLFFSHVTGLLTLKLVRNDYNIGALPILDESNVLELVEYTNPSVSEAVNQLTVNYVDRDNNPRSITVHDLAGISRMGGTINAASVDFVGISDPDTAAKLATRELVQRCTPIASCVLEINRKNSGLEPGSCFVFNWAALGVQNVVMRVVEVEVGGSTAGSLRVKAVSDIYGRSASSFTTPTNSQWVSPENEPADALNRRVEEITWWQFVREFGESAAVLAELTDASTMITCFCNRPTSDALNYEMWARNAGATDWDLKDQDSFPFVSTLAAAVGPAVTSVLTLDDDIDTDLVLPGMYAMLENEMVAVVSIDGPDQITVARGILDTVPVSHPAGAMIWFHDNFFGFDQELRAVGEAVEVRILPATSRGRLDIADATTNSITTVGRMMRPYPPGNVQVNGSRWPVSIGAADELAITWAHRDRTAQTVSLNHQDEGSIGPEAGVTYTLRIYGETDTLLRTVSGITGVSYTYVTADEQADSGFDPVRLNTRLRFELESARAGLVSYQKWNIEILRV